nr:hypothetical protein [Mycoplasmopsis bovis]
MRSKLTALRERAQYYDDSESRRLLKVSQTINGLRLVEGNVPIVRFLPDKKSAVITLDSFSALSWRKLYIWFPGINEVCSWCNSKKINKDWKRNK